MNELLEWLVENNSTISIWFNEITGHYVIEVINLGRNEIHAYRANDLQSAIKEAYNGNHS